MQLIKPLVVVVLIAIVASLGTALYHLATDQDGSSKLLRSLTVRALANEVVIGLLAATLER